MVLRAELGHQWHQQTSIGYLLGFLLQLLVQSHQPQLDVLVPEVAEGGTAEAEDGTAVAEGRIAVGQIGEEPDLVAGVAEGGTAEAEDGTVVAEGRIAVGQIVVEPVLVAEGEAGTAIEAGTVAEAGTAAVGTEVFVEAGLAVVETGLAVVEAGLAELVDVGLAEHV